MNKLSYLLENLSIAYNHVNLMLLCVIAIVCAISVITSKNPIVSVLFLVGLFLSISIYLILLGSNFIGLSYLLVYVGAVSILFLFILMLINVRISELSSNNSNSIPLAIMITLFFISNLFTLVPNNTSSKQNDRDITDWYDNVTKDELTYTKYDLNKFIDDTEIPRFNNYSKMMNHIKEFEDFNDIKEYEDFSDITFTQLITNNTQESLNNVSNPIWDGNLVQFSDITSIGSVLYTTYPLFLILTSIVLLLAMVGAIIITLKQKNI